MGARTGRPRGWRDDKAWRQARARKAGAAARRAHMAAARERAKGLKGPAAFSRGYRVGYQRAYGYWKAWALRAVAQARGES